LRVGRARLLSAVTVAMLALLAPLPDAPAHAQADAWPQKPVTIIVPFAPGGNTDGIARIIGQHLGDELGQQFVIDNRPGAGGVLAAEAVAKADSDGYTLFLATVAQIAIAPAISKKRYDPIKDFAPISNIATNPFVLAVHPSLPAKSLPEFVEHVRAQPSKLVYGTPGVGGVSHLCMALLLQRTGLHMNPVAYKGNGPAMNDLVAGHIPTMFLNLSEALPHAKGGTLRLLAVSSSKRVPQLADVPTVAESGYPGFDTLTWNGLMAPAGTPKAIVDRLAGIVARTVKDPKVVERFASYGIDPLGSSPEAFAATVAADTVMWAEAVKVAGVQQQ
jgi:tripartite-type tricarboxylate transporter receptor subunit TctC